MNDLLVVILTAAACFFAAYWTYGRVLSRLLRLDGGAKTPAVEFRDDIDYEPINRQALLSQHFSAIAAAGPIVGPIVAGTMFGWLPALCWIVIGAIFIGGVHDITALVASIRHRAGSIAEVAREHIGRRSFQLFMTFVWLALIYIIVAFTDITASSFVGAVTLENGQTVKGGGIATSSLLYLALPIAMGLLVRYTKVSMGMAALIFVPLVGLAIWVGGMIPLELDALIQRFMPNLSAEQAQHAAHKTWNVALLVYCCIASLVPMWILLQPRGYLGGYFLYIALAGGMLGLLLSGQSIQFPAFTGWQSASGATLFPALFITIACGACSGFHALIASGTTSKQLSRETDAKLIGYGCMLLEGMVAVISLCCVMILAADSALAREGRPNFIYAQGIGRFLQVLGIPPELGVTFALMAFTTFVYDTLDVCTRLGRYIIQEATGWHDRRGRWLGTAATAGVAMIFILQTTVDPRTQKVVPVWQSFWALFGASNQLLAALTLLTVSVWLWRTRRARWVWFVTGVPLVWMYAMSTWALVQMATQQFSSGPKTNPVPWVATVLVVLALLIAVEAVIAILGSERQHSEFAESGAA